MTDYTFKVKLDGITELECFTDASKDELKVLIAILSLGGKSATAEEIGNIVGTSKARVMAALALFEESGVIEKRSPFLAEVEYEFEPKKDEEEDKVGIKTSNDIRHNEEMRAAIIEIETIFGKTLTTTEVQRINSLHIQKGLSIPYILTLAAFIKDSYKSLTVNRVVTEANKLIAKNITELEGLEIYMQDKSQAVAGEEILRNLLGIFNRTLTKSERDLFKKWMHDYGYSESIIGEAYDINVNATGNRSLNYMDKILTSWHEAGCKTLDECRSKAEMHKYEGRKNANNSSQKSKKTVEAETPKYTDFNSEDALMRALERSYGDSDS